MSGLQRSVRPSDKRVVVGIFAGVFVSALVVALVAYFAWCPRFGHGGASDEEQITALALVDAPQSGAPRVYVGRNHAIVAWSLLDDQQRHEEVFAKRSCRWRLIARTDAGFERKTLFALGVPVREADDLFARLLEGYAEGP